MSTVTVTKEMHLHVKSDGSRHLHDSDLSRWPKDFGVAIGKVACTITYADITDADPRQALIGKLEEQINKTRADCERAVTGLREQISKLQCLEYQPRAEG